MFLVKPCHSYCSGCSSAVNTDCSACATGYKLSGTTCETNCLSGYGEKASTPQVCIYCSLYCTSCYELSTNCSSCQTNGTYESYLHASSCVTACPSFYSEDTSSHTCQPCTNSDCLDCEPDNFPRCFQCNSQYWHDFDCLTVCPDGYFEDVSNCTLCDPSCALCDADPSPCSQCTPGHYLYTSTCGTTCPVDYFPHDPTLTCRDCATYCVTATLDMSLVNGQIKINITFSQDVNMTTLSY